MNRAQELETRINQLKYSVNRLENDDINAEIAHFAWLTYRVLENMRAELAELRTPAPITVISMSEDAGQ